MEYPLQVRSSDGRKFGAFREWALDMAMDEAREVAALTKKPARVFNLDTEKWVWSTDKTEDLSTMPTK
jgi:hypothetical protein